VAEQSSTLEHGFPWNVDGAERSARVMLCLCGVRVAACARKPGVRREGAVPLKPSAE
jgi:hypothetical protein